MWVRSPCESDSTALLWGGGYSVIAFLLIGMQEDEVTEELLTFHEAVHQMQIQEEELLDAHHQLTEVRQMRLLLLLLTEIYDCLIDAND